MEMAAPPKKCSKERGFGEAFVVKQRQRLGKVKSKEMEMAATARNVHKRDGFWQSFPRKMFTRESGFGDHFDEKNKNKLPSPERFELSRGNPMYLAGTRLNHSAKATADAKLA